MPFAPKASSPDYDWLEPVSELRALLQSSDPRYDVVFSALFNEDMELLVVDTFCQSQPGNPSAITVADLLTDEWINKFRQSARQAAFYRLCEEV